jgi:hypothetical protein
VAQVAVGKLHSTATLEWCVRANLMCVFPSDFCACRQPWL